MSTFTGWLSAACAVHCLLVPVLAGAAPVALEAQVGALDTWLVPAVVGIAGLSAIASYLQHRRLRFLGFTALGLLAFVVGHWLEHEHVLAFSGLVGAVILSISMFVTTRQLHARDHAECAH